MKKLLSVALCLMLLVGIMALTVSAAGNYYVAGVSALCGSNWNPSDANNKMSDPDGDGIYSITYKNVKAGSYEFKVTDGTWDNCWPGSNYQLNLDKDADVTINFNASKNEVTVVSNGLGGAPVFEVKSAGIMGTGIDALGNWGTDLVMNKISDGIYECVVENVPANASMEFKFRLNSDWTHNFGAAADPNVVSGQVCEGVNNGQNIKLTTTEECNITFRLDITAYDPASKLGATYTITVAPVASEEETTAPSEEETTAPSEEETTAPAEGTTEGTTTPVTPDDSNPKDGDTISVFVALLAISAVGIAVIGKKKF